MSVWNPNAKSTTVFIPLITGSGTLTAVYRSERPISVGGVIMPMNSLMTLVPYLAVIGLVATVAVKKRRN